MVIAPAAHAHGVQRELQDDSDGPAMINTVRFELEPGALLPSIAKVGDAGLDLATWGDGEGALIEAGERTRIYTGVKALHLPGWAFGLLHTRSSTRERWGLEVRSSVIDTLYRGPLYIGVHNVSDRAVVVPSGTRLAQLVLMQNCAINVRIEQGVVDTRTERGCDGFGSSGH
jgi:deoxyuridine 5'-triphosphate nucleotidohydrolase